MSHWESPPLCSALPSLHENTEDMPIQKADTDKTRRGHLNQRTSPKASTETNLIQCRLSGEGVKAMSYPEGDVSQWQRAVSTASQQVHCDTVWLWVALTEAEPAGKGGQSHGQTVRPEGRELQGGVRSERTGPLRHSGCGYLPLPGFGQSRSSRWRERKRELLFFAVSVYSGLSLRGTGFWSGH